MGNTVAAIIDEKGGPAVFAERVGCRPGAVRVWKHRNQFPRKAWPEISTAFPDLSIERLIEIEAAPSCQLDHHRGSAG